MESYVIGLDIGTTSAKAVLFKKDGVVVAESESLYSVSHPQPSWAEQDPVVIEKAAIASISSVVKKANAKKEQVCTVGLSSAMHSLICLNNHYEPLSPSIIWADGRSVKQAERLKRKTDIYLKTGTPIHPMSPLSKLVWMKENDYKPYQEATMFVSIKEYLLLQWFGVAVVDYSVASSTGLFNIHSFDWDDDVLEIASVRREQLSKPVPPTEVCQGLPIDIAEQMGLKADTPFVLGGSDGPLANLGIGATAPGDVAITVGTSGAIRQMSSKPKTDEKQEIFCYGVADNLWIMGGPTNNGGIAFQWMRDVLGEKEVELALSNGGSAYDLLTKRAATVSPGSNGLLFLPFLNGERAPYWDANARGSYIGLTLAHKKEHMIRAGLEGVVFSLYSVGEALERLAGEPVNLYASGGFARSPLWLQIVADIFGHPVQVPESHQSSAWGAAWFALLAIGEVSSLEAIKKSIPMKQTIEPNRESSEVYQELYKTYRQLYFALKPHFSALANFQRMSF
ncbi:gluconate kinase [Anaerobacillus arseniciselenatis]|uniref:Gluconate kinase n=1 Tax=Anaerobacillus arseniciselenatis TaxID=85682 RepID=A0A1S2LGS7_9BACI|nr:gluconokinase [Anaerobacillus arseniciselenatis]OIJ11581.1 gluconate kinase [Anaerobacillus arseniciselenatis]